MIEPEEPEHHRSSTSAPSMAESEEAAEKNVSGRDESKTSSPTQLNHESAYMESWKANFEADIKARDEKEALKKAELEATAKKACFTLILFIHYFYIPHQIIQNLFSKSILSVGL